MGRYHKFYPSANELYSLPVQEVDHSISVQDGQRLLQSGLLGGLLIKKKMNIVSSFLQILRELLMTVYQLSL
ncbi:hypothetical protein N752_14425 [Desulforamulus aquiferis]|nr:hypothetical protein [Desulforamulus aquiferis]RYD04565.1 hypothetical protein N752_14425 [Desulforamulus aquiferis]